MINNRSKLPVVIAATFSISLALLPMFFQNCARVAFNVEEDASKIAGDPDEVDGGDVDPTSPIVPLYATLRAGDEANFPPLKLVFVVDNSGTMRINQINLGQAFEKMFVGNNNEENLALFDTKAYLISTAQMSLDRNHARFGLLPSKSLASFETLSFGDFLSQYRPQILDGQVPGDLVGYRLIDDSSSGKRKTSFEPAPVAGFGNVGGLAKSQLVLHKPVGGSVSAFSAEFKDRLAILDPDRSKLVDTSIANREGVLDAVVNQESGLCGLARLLKHDRKFLNASELTAYVLVSDEENADAQGSNCIDSLEDYTPEDRFVDVQCQTPVTKIDYQVRNPAERSDWCRVSYDTGFTYRYEYKLPNTVVTYSKRAYSWNSKTTKINYFRKTGQTYKTRKTRVEYYNRLYVHDIERSKVTYNVVTSYNYAVPQTAVKYYIQEEVCVTRDNVPDCKMVPKLMGPVLLDGNSASSANCSAFIGSRLPGAVLNNAALPTQCSPAEAKQLTNQASCPTGMTCLKNYNEVMASGLIGNYVNYAGGCAQFLRDKVSNLSASVEWTGAKAPQCAGDTPGTSNAFTACPAGKICRDQFVKAAAKVELLGSHVTATCPTFIANNAGAFAAFPNAHLVFGNSANQPKCEVYEPSTPSAACPTGDANVFDCQDTLSSRQEYIVSGHRTIGTPAQCQALLQEQVMAGNPSNAAGDIVFEHSDATKIPSCAHVVVPKTTACALNDSSYPDCAISETGPHTKTVAGRPSQGQSCEQFVDAKQVALDSGAIRNESTFPVTCPAGSGDPAVETKTLLYSTVGASVPGIVSKSTCSAALLNYIRNANASLAVGQFTNCNVTGISSFTLPDDTHKTTCAAAGYQQAYCATDTGGKRNCRGQELPATAEWIAASPLIVQENVTCTTLCSATKFCANQTGTVADNYRSCVATAQPVANVGQPITGRKVANMASPYADICPVGQTHLVLKAPYAPADLTRVQYVAGSYTEQAKTHALADYVRARSVELYGEHLPFVSVFVRQPGIDPAGTGGGYGEEYNYFADIMNGQKFSVLKTEEYGGALENLGKVIRERLNRSFSIGALGPNQRVRQVWHKRQGGTAWGQPLMEGQHFTASGGTITLSPNYDFDYGDEFKFEYY